MGDVYVELELENYEDRLLAERVTWTRER